MSQQQNRTFMAMFEPTVNELGYELLGCLYLAQGRHAVLRVYIDSPSGITVDDCQKVSHQLSAILDVEDPIGGEYHLEISSPGLDRPLFTLGQFERFIGYEAKVKMRTPINGQRNFVGIISKIEGDIITLSKDELEYALVYSDVERANLVPQF